MNEFGFGPKYIEAMEVTQSVQKFSCAHKLALKTESAKSPNLEWREDMKESVSQQGLT
jgi:hypothetical protein